MEQFINELKNQKTAIIKSLDKQNEQATLEQLINEHKQAKDNLNNYTSQEQQTLKEQQQIFNIRTTKYFYYYDKTKQKALETIEQETQKALEQLLKIDEVLCYLIMEHITKFDQDKQQINQTANKINNIILLLKEIVEG
jgi:hypothetical protein